MLEKQESILIRKAKLCRERIGRSILTGNIPFEAEYAHSRDAVPLGKSIDLPRVPVREGDRWAGAWESGYFRLRATVPSGWAGSTVAARLDFSSEALVYSKEGVPLYGLTNGSVFDRHFSKDVYRIAEPCRGGEEVELYVEAAANVLFGIDRPADPQRQDPDRHGTFNAIVKHMKLCRFDTELWALNLDLEVLIGMLEILDRRKTLHGRILGAVNEAVNAYGDDPSNAKAAREALRPIFSLHAGDPALTSVTVGHAHIDTGWLWRVGEAYRKSARTFASQLELLRRYPGYIFGASQAQHYAFVKERYPALYEEIRKAVQTGRWELQGGMWVEADCNITSGESLVRQFLHGKNFFLDEFGIDVKNCWIPDVFGYSASMPQIMKEAGIEYFLTQKMSWNQFNRFPYTTFRWRGIDGTEVLTHFPPEDTYNSEITPAGLQRSEANFEEKAVLDEFMTLFGIGDGGGGPKEEFVERALRFADFPGVPRVKFGTAAEFFERLAKHASALPVWVGELYLELHRGTLTTQSRVKRGNRKLERLLAATEHLASCLPLESYPVGTLDGAWKLLLLNQFHDILPGSGIHALYEDTAAYHEKASNACAGVLRDASDALFREDADSLVVFNPVSYACNRPVALPTDWTGYPVFRKDGKNVELQQGDGMPIVLTELPPHSFVTLVRGGRGAGAGAGSEGLPGKTAPDSGTPVSPGTGSSGAGPFVLENELVQYLFDGDGRVIDALDKETGRRILAGNGNVLSLYVDRPHSWDAWDIDFDYEDQLSDTAHGTEARVLYSGTIANALSFTLSIGSSEIRQTVSLAAGSKRLDFECIVEWREFHKLLRVSFPAAVRSAEAVFDIQYGHAKRPTHRNTSWDIARFEVAAQRFADLSSQDEGLSLLSDCKYGYSVRDNVLGLSLLRSPTDPDPDADLGTHRFVYCILPHTGSFADSGVIGEASLFDTPPLVFPGKDASRIEYPFSVEGEGVSLEVVKRAEKENAWIFRLVETRGRRSSAELVSRRGPVRIVRTDIMERVERSTPTVGTRHRMALEPFQILTLKGLPG